MPKSWETKAPESWAEATANGDAVAVPGNRMNVSAKYPHHPQGLDGKHGIPDPENWEDYIEPAKTIAEKKTPESGAFALHASSDNRDCGAPTSR